MQSQNAVTEDHDPCKIRKRLTVEKSYQLDRYVGVQQQKFAVEDGDLSVLKKKRKGICESSIQQMDNLRSLRVHHGRWQSWLSNGYMKCSFEEYMLL